MHGEQGERLPAPERTMMDDTKAAHDKREATAKAEQDEGTQTEDDESKKAWRR